jgi:hypothetical protein
MRTKLIVRQIRSANRRNATTQPFTSDRPTAERPAADQAAVDPGSAGRLRKHKEWIILLLVPVAVAIAAVTPFGDGLCEMMFPTKGPAFVDPFALDRGCER